MAKTTHGNDHDFLGVVCGHISSVNQTFFSDNFTPWCHYRIFRFILWPLCILELSATDICYGLLMCQMNPYELAICMKRLPVGLIAPAQFAYRILVLKKERLMEAPCSQVAVPVRVSCISSTRPLDIELCIHVNRPSKELSELDLSAHSTQCGSLAVAATGA